MKKKLVALLLGTAMMTSILSGCGKKETQTSEPTKAPESNQEDETVKGTEETEEYKVTYPVSAEGEKLTIWTPIAAPTSKYFSSYNELELYKVIQEKTGIQIEFIHPAAGQEKEQLNVLMASGDLPDIIEIRGLYTGGSPAGVEDGVFLDLTELVPQYAPDYYKLITANDDVYRLATTNDERITDLNILKQSAPEFSRINFLDTVIKKYNITEMPVTLDDYEALMKKMKADGMYGFALNANGIWNQFMYPFGITPGFCLDEDGKVMYSQTTEAYKEYLTLMNRWYESGYIYKDFMSNLTAIERRNLLINEEVGFLMEPVDLAYSAAKAQGKSIVPANYPRMTADQEIPFRTVSFDTLPIVNGANTVITTQCKNPELALQYLNFFYTEEGADLVNWGIEGETYEVDADGNKKFTDGMLKNPKYPVGDTQYLLKMHICAKLAEPDIVCNPNVVSDAYGLEIRNMYSDDPLANNSRVLPGFALEPEAASERSQIMRDINTFVDEMTLKFITGVSPMSDYDKYVETINGMNIDRAIEITQEQYNQFMSKSAK